MDIVGIKRFLNKNKDKTLDEIISETGSVVNGIGNVIGNSGSPAGTDTLFGLFKRGFVKSVQTVKINEVATDALDYDFTYKPPFKAFNISSVNVSKSIVIINSRTEQYDGSNTDIRYTVMARLYSSTVLRVYGTRFDRNYIVDDAIAQVIEFY